MKLKCDCQWKATPTHLVGPHISGQIEGSQSNMLQNKVFYQSLNLNLNSKPEPNNKNPLTLEYPNQEAQP